MHQSDTRLGSGSTVWFSVYRGISRPANRARLLRQDSLNVKTWSWCRLNPCLFNYVPYIDAVLVLDSKLDFDIFKNAKTIFIDTRRVPAGHRQWCQLRQIKLIGARLFHLAKVILRNHLFTVILTSSMFLPYKFV